MDQALTEFFILDHSELNKPSRFYRKSGGRSAYSKTTLRGKLHRVALKMRHKTAEPASQQKQNLPDVSSLLREINRQRNDGDDSGVGTDTYDSDEDSENEK